MYSFFNLLVINNVNNFVIYMNLLVYQFFYKQNKLIELVLWLGFICLLLIFFNFEMLYLKCVFGLNGYLIWNFMCMVIVSLLRKMLIYCIL